MLDIVKPLSYMHLFHKAIGT